jgi:two-component system nitrogen regulation response regulator NtrX
MPRILIADDQADVLAALSLLLKGERFQIESASSPEGVLRSIEVHEFDVVLIDLNYARDTTSGSEGLDLLSRIRAADPTLPVVVMTAWGSVDLAVEAMRRGARDFIQKPWDNARLLAVLRTQVELGEALRRGKRLEAENIALRDSVSESSSELPQIVSESPAMRSVLNLVERIGPADANVLITGENGTGKELVARAVHRQSARAKKPFVEVNCAAIPSELIESELFGHMKGSFTGAVQDRAGKFEQADGGTLFLDEIGDMSLNAQAKVLRVLQDNVVTRIGGSKPIQVDVRVLAATNKNLEEEIAAGRFREDLFYRLNVVPLAVPPLRERRDDIPSLVAHFINTLSEREGVHPRTIAPEAVQRLAGLEWPGNVRELRNTIERLLILSSGPRITEADVDRLVGRRAGDGASLGSLLEVQTFEEFKHAAERAFLVAKLRQFDWNVSETARALDMPRSNLYKKIERYGLTRENA